jgi:hypothetical protein
VIVKVSIHQENIQSTEQKCVSSFWHCLDFSCILEFLPLLGLTLSGLILIYRSKRRGYTYYVIGQMVEISRVFFKTELKMTVIKQEVQFDTVYVKYK